MKPSEREYSRIVLLLCHTALTQTIQQQTTDVIAPSSNWEAVLSLAARQGVLAIAWDGLGLIQQHKAIDSARQPRRETLLRWAVSVDKIEQRYARQREVIAKLAKIYAEEEITMTILKGYGLSLCYPTPQHRACSDIDIWLGGRQKEGDEALRTKYNIAIDEGLHHHTVFYIDGVMVENHYDFINVHAHTSSRKIEVELKARAKETGKSIEIEDTHVTIPNANLHALFLLRHAAAHFAGAEIVLRHIFDWAMFVKVYGNDIDWQWLYDLCHKQGMNRFVYAMNGLAIELCGITSSMFGKFERIGEVETEILNDIIEPRFAKQRPKKGLLRIVTFKLHRWWANRWKRKLVYNEGELHSFVTQTWSHILKPRGIKH